MTYVSIPFSHPSAQLHLRPKPPLTDVPPVLNEWRESFFKLREAERDAHAGLLEQLHEMNRNKIWKERGCASFKEFCRIELRYTAAETRELMIELGMILPARQLTSSDPLIRLRIESLREWRSFRARAESIAAYRVISNRTLMGIAEKGPTNEAELQLISGIGPSKLAAYADDLLRLIATTRLT